MDIIAYLLRSIFILTVLGTISPYIILGVSHLLTFILSCTVLKYNIASRKVVNIQLATTLILLKI